MDRSNLSTAILGMFQHAYDETRRQTGQIKVLMDTMGAANDNYKQVNISVKGGLRFQMNVFDRNIPPKLAAGEI